jgi:hypothetical protein
VDVIDLGSNRFRHDQVAIVAAAPSRFVGMNQRLKGMVRTPISIGSSLHAQRRRQASACPTRLDFRAENAERFNWRLVVPTVAWHPDPVDGYEGN